MEPLGSPHLIEEEVHESDEKQVDEVDAERPAMNVLDIVATWMTLRELLGKKPLVATVGMLCSGKDQFTPIDERMPKQLRSACASAGAPPECRETRD